LQLAEFAKSLLATEPKIDYFATSLPNLLLYDDDLVKRNSVESLLLSALARHGLGDRTTAIQQLKLLLVEDQNHLLAIEMLHWIQSDVESAQ